MSHAYTRVDYSCARIHESCDQTNHTLLIPRKSKSYKCVDPIKEQVQCHTLVFNVEETLLKSSSSTTTSWFPFFMLVAFEGGGLFRALILLLLYPFLICLVNEEMKLSVIVFVCFFGIKKKSFRIGSIVLPKFFLEDVGLQGFEMIMRFGKKVGVSSLPKVMVEGFLKDYLGVDIVVGREVKVFGGYYMGLLETKEKFKDNLVEVLGEENMSQVIAMFGSTKSINENNDFKEIYMVNEDDKKKWDNLPREKYPKPLIFHDGRLAFLPTPLASLAMFIWLPFGVILCIIRIIVSHLPNYKISTLVLAFLGASGITNSKVHHLTKELFHNNYNHNVGTKNSSKRNNIVFVCNHKTLLDPIYISFSQGGISLVALTYSISKTSQLMSPIKTMSLTRDRVKDFDIMRKALDKTNIVIFPEGTTCREPHLLRFSPLFTEVSEEFVLVALEVKVSMFYGTSASGIKALDPVLFLLNPYPFYIVNYLERLSNKSLDVSETNGWFKSKVEIANYVQSQIGEALGYKCTRLTRKDKYKMLAGHNGTL